MRSVQVESSYRIQSKPQVRLELATRRFTLRAPRHHGTQIPLSDPSSFRLSPIFPADLQPKSEAIPPGAGSLFNFGNQAQDGTLVTRRIRVLTPEAGFKLRSVSGRREVENRMVHFLGQHHQAAQVTIDPPPREVSGIVTSVWVHIRVQWVRGSARVASPAALTECRRASHRGLCIAMPSSSDSVPLTDLAPKAQAGQFMGPPPDPFRLRNLVWGRCSSRYIAKRLHSLA